MMCIAYFLTAGQLLFDEWGFGCVWVGLGQLSGGFGWVDENRPTDNSGSDIVSLCNSLAVFYERNVQMRTVLLDFNKSL